jgi:hypothetical protein
MAPQVEYKRMIMSKIGDTPVITVIRADNATQRRLVSAFALCCLPMPSSAQNKQCTFCNNMFSARGLGSHEKSCRRKVEEEIRALETGQLERTFPQSMIPCPLILPCTLFIFCTTVPASTAPSAQFEADDAMDLIDVDQGNDWQDIRGKLRFPHCY